MPSAGFEEFDNTIQKTNALLKDIEAGLGWEGRRNQSYAALRAVLHSIRDLLIPEEAVQLAAQLPTLLKGIYYEGWKPSQTPKRMNNDEFMQNLRQQMPFTTKEGIDPVIEVVLKSLRRYISFGEAEDIVATLPKDIAHKINQYI